MAETQYTPIVVGVVDENFPPLRSSQPAVDIPGFFDAVEQAMALYIKTEEPPDNTTPTLVHEYPKERLAIPDDMFDVITYKVAEATMAPTLNDGSRPRSPKQRELKKHPTLAGYNLQILAWTELIQAEFSVWSKSSRNADLVAAWFHGFMVKYAFAYKFFMSRGVNNFRFVKRADDDVDQSYGQEVYRRRLVYEFRLETLFAIEQKQLTDIDVTYGISGPTDSIELKPTQ
jgi:hypothetical protein